MSSHSPIPAITINGVDLSKVYEKSSITDDTRSQKATRDRLYYGPDTDTTDGDDLAKAFGNCTFTGTEKSGEESQTYELSLKVCMLLSQNI
ncbi:hypothetical protein SBOR_2533 [Sclerotinia borealis F-4128]|uniref:Uncharacterized protein n=1 Tax=Sclerotinia borealis (strain F-4128) TaxID=1432307 RepID=W9CM37_SCLBF|nr:hypothetical protein SBOR_2533 [Sclerotinia borealis F-4128]